MLVLGFIEEGVMLDKEMAITMKSRKSHLNGPEDQIGKKDPTRALRRT